jgi:hypothetical protein
MTNQAGIVVYNGQTKRKNGPVLIAQGPPVTLVRPIVDAVLAFGSKRQQFSLRATNLTGTEILTLQSGATDPAGDVIAVLHTGVRAKPVLLRGRIQDQTVTLKEKEETVAVLTKCGENELSISARPEVDTIRAFGILISMFLVEK